MRKIYIIVFLLTSFFANAQIRISQVYGAGGNTGATYNQDFVELFNAGASPTAIGGWSLQYASSTGPSTTPFNWAVAAIPSGVTIPAGGYYLVALAAGSNGIALPTPDATITTVNMGSASGKIALVNNATAISGTTACNAASVVDVLGWGLTSPVTSCGETTPFIATGITTAQCMKRGNNGCTDANNNSTDFSIVAVSGAPRNSASPINLCTSPTLSASPNITGLATTFGTASLSQSFNLTAANLTPTVGNVTLTPTVGLEISFNNSTFFTTAQTLAYTGGAITSTPIYVRIAATAAQGALSAASVTVSGGGAANVVVTVAGTVTKNYYCNASGPLNVAATWGDNTMGTLNPPADFTIPYAIFNVVNRTTTMIGGSGSFELSGTNSKLIIGDGINPTNLITTPTDYISSATTVEVTNLSTLTVGNQVAPILTNLAIGSTVDYSFPGATGTPALDTSKINNTTAYFNLKLTNGLKYLKSGTTTVNGNLTYDGTVNSNGAGSPFSTIILKGDLAMTNAALIEDSTTGFTNRYTLTLAATAPTQTINTGTSELRIFRLQRDSAVLTNLDINLAANSKICIGNIGGGDIKLLQKVAGTPTITKLIMNANSQLAIVKNASVLTDAVAAKTGTISATNAKIIINKSVTSTIAPGTLKFENFSTLSELTINITTPAKDSVTVTNINPMMDDAAVKITQPGNLSLTKGVLIVAPTQRIKLENAVTVTGGSASSYVDGKLNKEFIGAATFVYPVGKAKQYSPLELTTNLGNNYTVEYVKQPYSNLTVSSSTLMATPGYNVSNKEYWDIVQSNVGVGTPNIKFYYNNPASSVLDASLARIAHFNGTDWDDINRDANGSDANGTYVSKNAISSFSPFTFGGQVGVLPVLLESFNGVLLNNNSNIEWKTSCETVGDKFELQYSTDGRNYASINSTDAKGTCVGNVYAYIHTNAKAVVNYYRLITISTNGAKSISNVIVLKNSKLAFDVKLVATNTNEQIGYSIASPTKGMASLQIVNMQGQVMLAQNITYAIGTQIRYINTNNFGKGMYFLTITNNDGEKTTVKFVK
jgi:Lamin Tail Domain/Secretion system C-terminal sorting domain